MEKKSIMPSSADEAPLRFCCLLTGKVMSDPVSTRDGYTFDRVALENCLDRNGNECPITGRTIDRSEIEANALLQWEILYWKRKNNVSSTSLSSLDSDGTRHSTNSRALPIDKKIDTPPSKPAPSSDVYSAYTEDDDAESEDLKKCDSPPSVPRRKGSECDLMSMFSLAMQNDLKKSYDKNKPPVLPCRTSQSLLDIVRPQLYTDISPQDDESGPVDILDILDQVESTLGGGADDLFAGF